MLQKDHIILILSNSDLTRDPRVSRQIKWLNDYVTVVAGGLTGVGPDCSHARFIEIGYVSRRLKNKILTYLKKHNPYLSRILMWSRRLAMNAFYAFQKSKGLVLGNTSSNHSQISGGGLVNVSRSENSWFGVQSILNVKALDGLDPDLVIVNDLDTLVVACNIFDPAKVIFDAHEFSPGEYDEGDYWNRQEKPRRVQICKSFLPKIAAVSAVCDGVLGEYTSAFELPSSRIIVENCPSYLDISPTPTSDKIKIVHHGIGTPIRKLELMADAVLATQHRFELHFMLTEGDIVYIDNLKKKYESSDRVFFHKPVPMNDISKTISAYDIGLFILEPHIVNYKHALPNKFFEFIQARLAIAIGPSPEMKRVVDAYGIGIVSEDFTPASMALALDKLTSDEIDRFKNATQVAAAVFSSENNRHKFIEQIKQVIGK